MAKDNPTFPTGPDVRELRQQNYPEQVFPGGRNADFRVFFTPEVHVAIQTHARADTSVEICGVLVGRWARDPDGPFLCVEASIRGEAATQKFAEVTFTHDTWAKINQEMDSKFSHLSIVGWYHTHPDFGIFLSDRDVFIHQHFFGNPGNVALVVDPVRDIEGVFVWRSGKPQLAEHYWVGDRLLVCKQNRDEAEGIRSFAGPKAGSTSPNPTATTLAFGDVMASPWWMYLSLLLAMIAGWGLGSRQSAWEQKRLEAGAVAHFGAWKVLRVGLPEQLTRLEQEIAELGKTGLALADATASTSTTSDDPDAAQQRAALRKSLEQKLAQATQQTRYLRATYSFTPTEWLAVARLIQQKLHELNELPLGTSEEKITTKSNAESGKIPVAPSGTDPETGSPKTDSGPKPTPTSMSEQKDTKEVPPKPAPAETNTPPVSAAKELGVKEKP